MAGKIVASLRRFLGRLDHVLRTTILTLKAPHEFAKVIPSHFQILSIAWLRVVPPLIVRIRNPQRGRCPVEPDSRAVRRWSGRVSSLTVPGAFTAACRAPFDTDCEGTEGGPRCDGRD